MAGGLCLVPEGRGLFGKMSVEDNLYLGAFNNRAKSQMKENMRKVYDLFPILKERKSLKAGSLSGGEQQMLAIGRGLMTASDMLMLDEPSLGLSPVAVETMLEALRSLNQTGLTLLLVEQNIEAVLNIATRIYLIEDGRTVLEGKPEEIRNNPVIRESYLGI